MKCPNSLIQALNVCVKLKVSVSALVKSYPGVSKKQLCIHVALCFVSCSIMLQASCSSFSRLL